MQQALVLCPRNVLTKSSNLLEDGIGRSGPDERARWGMIGPDEVLDLGHQFFPAAGGARRPETVQAAADDSPGLQDYEPAGRGGDFSVGDRSHSGISRARAGDRGQTVGIEDARPVRGRLE